MNTNQAVDLVISFDSTGSMWPCITQVRKGIDQMVKQLFGEIPNLRLGIIAHGDYCDRDSSYVLKSEPLTTDPKKLARFVQTVGSTGGGGNGGEAYELVLNTVRSFEWRAGVKKILVMIGDEVPHKPFKHGNTGLDWRNELELLKEAGVVIYGVQALSNPGYPVDTFYEELAERTSGFKLNLNQLSQVVELIFAVAYKQVSEKRVEEYEQKLTAAGRLDRSLDAMFSRLLGRVATSSKSRPTKYTKSALAAVPPSRFQMLEVDEDQSIQSFVDDNLAVPFKAGRGFYELTKSVKVQYYKEVVLRDKHTGDMYTGPSARSMVGLPSDEDAKLKPVDLQKYDVFIQSTSFNRKLLGGTRFLYEVNEFSQ